MLRLFPKAMAFVLDQGENILLRPRIKSALFFDNFLKP